MSSKSAVFTLLSFFFASFADGAGATLSAPGATVGASGGNASFALTTSPGAAWTASSSAAWLTVSPPSGSTSATITYTYSANTSLRARTAAVQVAGAKFTIWQLGTTGAYNQWVNGAYGQIWTLAGGGPQGPSDGGPATRAFINVGRVAVDSNGNMFMADQINLRRVDAGTSIITTVAGGQAGTSGDGGPAAAAQMSGLVAVVLDAADNIFVADGCRIRRIDAVTQTITAFAGSNTCGYSGDGGLATAALMRPTALAFDSRGNLFIAEQANNRVRVINSATGIVSTVAGTGLSGFSGDSGQATGAQLSSPAAIALDQAGNLYIADAGNGRIRKVDSMSGNISTVAGLGGSTETCDGGLATSANLGQPGGVALDSNGNLYISDSSGFAIRKVSATTGIISRVVGLGTFAAYPGDGTPALQATITPGQILADSAGNIYIPQGSVVRWVDFSTPQTSFSPTQSNVSSAAGTGSVDLTVAPAGAFWIAFSSSSWLTPAITSGNGNATIGYSYTGNSGPYPRTALLTSEGRASAVTQAGSIVTLTPAAVAVGPEAGMGTASLGFPATVGWAAASDAPWLSVTPSGTGNATLTYTFMANPGRAARTGTITAGGRTLTITQASPTGLFTPWNKGGYGTVTTIARGGTGGVAVDTSGNVYFANGGTISRLDALTKTVSVFAGGGAQGTVGDGGPATSAFLYSVQGVAVDSGGNVFFADSGDNRIRRVDAVTRVITTIAGNGVKSFGGDLGPANLAGVNNPGALAIDGAGNLYFCDVGNYRVRRIDGATGVISTFAGNGVFNTLGDGGPATAASFTTLSAIAVDLVGNVFVGDASRVRRIDAATGTITFLADLGLASGLATDASGHLYGTDGFQLFRIDPSTGVKTLIGGSTAGLGGDGGPVLSAQFTLIGGLAFDAAGSLYITDTGNGRIRFVDYTTPEVTLAAASASVSRGAGTGSIAVTLSLAGAPWLAFSNVPWLTVTTPSGAGSGTIGYTFTGNISLFPRSGVITVLGRVLAVTQAGSTVTLSSEKVLAGTAAGMGTFDVSVTPAAAWTAQSTASWLTVTPSSGSSGTTLAYNFAANPSATARTAGIFVAGRRFVITQQGTSGSWVPWSTSSAYSEIQRVAGPGISADISGDFGPALAAFLAPTATTSDLNGNIYISDVSSRIRRIDSATRIIAPLAGSGLNGFAGDGGAAISASLSYPASLTVDSGFNLYFADSGNGRIRRVDGTTGIITTLAGSGDGSSGGDGGPATEAGLISASSLVLDGAGNLFFDGGDARIRRIDAQTGTITTVAGTGKKGYSGDSGQATAAMISGGGIAVDGAGNLYISDSDNQRIRRVDTVTGIITTVAGTGATGYTGDGGPGASATLNSPVGVLSDDGGDLFFSDQGNSAPRLRRVDASTGTIATVAGSGTCCQQGIEDGTPGLLSPLGSVYSLDPSGNVYMAGVQNGTQITFGTSSALHAIDFTTPATLFGLSAVSAAATAGAGSVPVTAPSGVAWTAASNVGWLSLTSASGTGDGSVGYTLAANDTPFTRVAVIFLNGQSVTITQAPAATGLSASSTYAAIAGGSGTVDLTTTAKWLAVSSASWLTVSPASGTGSTTLTYTFTANTSTNGRIAALTIAGRKFAVTQPGTLGNFTPWGVSGRNVIQTIVGNGSSDTTFSGDGGPAAAAGIVSPAIVTDDNGNVWIADTARGRVRRVNAATRIITTVAGTGTAGSSGDNGPALSAQITPGSLAVDIAGNLFIADAAFGRIRRVDAATGNITTVAGGGLAGDGSLAVQASLSQPTGLYVDGGGNIFFADPGNERVRRVDFATGVISTVASRNAANSVVIDPAGTVYFTEGNRLQRVDTTGTLTSLSVALGLTGVALDGTGRLYVTSANASSVVQSADPATGALTPIAGTSAFGFSGDGGPALAAQFSNPTATSTDGAGNLYIADAANHRVRFVDLVTPGVSLGAATASVGADAGTGTVSITVSPAGAPWFATSNTNWLTATSGTGSGTLMYSFLPNASPNPRMGVISVFGKTLTVTQAGSRLANSTVTLTPRQAFVSPAAGSGTFQLAITPAAAWTATSSAAWLTVSPSSGSAGTTLTYTFAANAGTPARTATITAAGKSFTLAQTGTSGTYTPWGSTSNGGIFTIAGNGSFVYSGDNGPAILSGLGLLDITSDFPAGIAVDRNGNVFVAEPRNNRVRRVDAATGVITTAVGTGVAGGSGDGSSAVLAQLNQPHDVKFDAAGNLLIADTRNNKVRRVDASTGIISTVAGSGTFAFSGDGAAAVNAGLKDPTGVAVDASNNVFISDTYNHRVRRVDALTGIITTIAGLADAGYSGDGGPASAAALYFPQGLATDASGNLFIADSSNNVIRRIDAATGKISTVAGGAMCCAAGDGGPATSAALVVPSGVTVDASGNLLVSDTGGNRIRRVDAASGVITTIAGNGTGAFQGDGGPAISAAIRYPVGVALDGSGNIYISDGLNQRIRLVDLVSPKLTFAASSATVGSAAGTGTVGITISPVGALWSASSSAAWLTLTTPTGAGSGNIAYSFTANPKGSLRSGTITAYGQTFTVFQPAGVVVAPTATTNPRSAVVPAGAGSGTFALSMTAAVDWQAASSASWLTVSPNSGNGNATVTFALTANSLPNARIATITIAGAQFGVTQASASGSYVPWEIGGYGSLSPVAGSVQNGVNALAVDGNGGVYYSSGSLYRIDPTTKIVSAVPANPASAVYASGLARDSSGNLIATELGAYKVLRIDAVTQAASTFAGNGSYGSSGDGGLATGAMLAPLAIGLDGADNVYLSDGARIRFVNAASGTISAFAGTGVLGFSGDGGLATAASIAYPGGIAVGSNGNVYFSDTGNHRVRRITVSGIISTAAGTGVAGYSGDGGPATAAALNRPYGLALDAAGNLYIADGVVRRVDAITGIITTVAGDGAGFDPGTAHSISLSANSLAFDPAGNLYIGDSRGVHVLDLTSPRVSFQTTPASVGAAASSASAAFTIFPEGSLWGAFSTDSWLTVTTSSGTGSGSVGYSFSTNGSPWPRTGTFSVLGQPYTVTQAGASLSLSAVSATVTAAPGNGTFAVTTTLSWSASSDATWLTVSPASGNGNATLTYTFSANAGVNSRSGRINVSGTSLLIIQAGTSGIYSPLYTPWNTTFPDEITTIAGNGQDGFSGDGGPAVAAMIGPTRETIALDPTGNLYLANTSFPGMIRRVDVRTGIITTIAGNGKGGDGGPASVAAVSPVKIAFSPAGDLYVAELSGHVRRIDHVNGIITTVAGTGSSGFSGDGGLATAAKLAAKSVAVDIAGNIYIADRDNNRVRRVDGTTGLISTVAGGGQSSGTGIPATSAALTAPNAVALGRNGNLFILDNVGSPLPVRILRLDTATGLVWPVVNGTGGDGIPALLSSLGNTPTDLATDPAGNLFVADGRVRRIDAQTGLISTIAGGGAFTPGDGGLALNANILASGIATDAAGNLYVGDQSRIRFVDLTTPQATVPVSINVPQAAGTGTIPIVTSPGGAFWSPSTASSWITFTTPSGSGAGSIGFSFSANPTAYSRTASIIVLGQTVSIIQAGISVMLSPAAASLSGAASATGTLALTVSPSAAWTPSTSAAWITVSPTSGNGSATLTWSATANGGSTARMATLNVLGKTFQILQPGTSGTFTPWGVSGRGQIHTAAGGGVSVLDGVAATSASLNSPVGAAVDLNGNLYIASGTVRKIDIATGTIKTVAGNGSASFSGDGGQALQAGLSATAAAFDSLGNLYISDTGRIRRVDSSGIINTIAGNGTLGSTGDGGPALQALVFPGALALDAEGNLYFLDGSLNVQDGHVFIRKIDQSTGLISTIEGGGALGVSTVPTDGAPARQIGIQCMAIAADAPGNVYCADDAWARIFRIDSSSGTISTFAGASSLLAGALSGDGGQAVNSVLSRQLRGLTVDAAGNVYIADYGKNVVRRVDGQTGVITTVAGSGVNGYSGDGGPATLAAVGNPRGLATDPAGNLYIATPSADSIRAVDLSTPAIPQTITFAALPNLSFGVTPIPLSAASSSGLTVSFTSTTTSVCVVSLGTIGLLNSGLCSITASQAGNATYAPAVPVTRSFTVLFNDLSSGDYFYSAVNLMAQKGITAGCGSNGYCPGQAVTRAQMAIFIVRAIQGGDSFGSSFAPYFADVPQGAFGFSWIQRMKELGITAGCGSGNFCPDATVTREQMAVFIIRARLGVNLAGANPTFTFPSVPYFTDVPNTDPAFAWVQRLRLDSITAGCSATAFCPSAPVTRGDMAIFIMRGAFNQLLPPATPVITQISSPFLALGTTGTFTITGSNTNFVQGTTQLSALPGVTIGTLTVNSAISLTVQLTAAANATAQPYSILVVTGSEQAVLPNGLTLQ